MQHDALAEAEVTALDGSTIKLGSLWADQPVVLVFLRHFGWLFCREQAAQLRGELGKIHAAGAELVFIGNGAPHFAEAFKKDYDVTSPLFTDPSRKAYDAAGLKYGAGSILKSLKHAARAMRKGFFQGRTQGSAWQQGGVLVVDRGGKLLYSYASQEGGDHPPVEDIHTALASAHAA